MRATLSAPDLLALVEERGVRFIDLQFTDVVGVVKNVYITSEWRNRRNYILGKYISNRNSNYHAI